MQQLLKNKAVWITLVIIALAVISWYWYRKRQKAREEKNLQDFHQTKYNASFNGDNVPEDFNPQPVADALYQSMKGAGTSEIRFFSLLEPLNEDQRTVVHNAFNATYGRPPCKTLLDRLNPANNCSGVNGVYLREWIVDDFDGDELTKALSFFAHIPEFNRNQV